MTSASQMGGATSFTYGYDDFYRLTSASGSFDHEPTKQHSYKLDMAYDTIHNIASKTQNHFIRQPSGALIAQKKTSYDWNDYLYQGAQPHAPTHIGERTFAYDANGNQTGWTHDRNGTRRSITWDEENRIQSVADNGHTMTYKYDHTGARVIKQGPQGETVYVNQFFTIRNREAGTKHVFAGATRVVSKLMKQPQPGGTPPGGANNANNPHSPVEKDLYFYHPDHLGSSSYITDTKGDIYEHLEYFPFGETWVEESSNTQRTPYLFTGKELDEETQLYYFGARYYDPRTSVWQSPDPILAKYLPTGDRDRDQKLPGMGGVFNSRSLGLYGYAGQNPVLLIDPDGNAYIVLDPGHGGTAPGAIAEGGQFQEKNVTLSLSKMTGFFLRLRGHRVSYTRTRDQTLSLGQRARVANEARADYFISIHVDSHERGSQMAVLYYEGTQGLREEQREFAFQLYGALDENKPAGSRVTIFGSGLGVLSPLDEDGPVGALIETGNVQSPEDTRRLGNFFTRLWHAWKLSGTISDAVKENQNNRDSEN